jgi:hypothetical protein
LFLLCNFSHFWSIPPYPDKQAHVCFHAAATLYWLYRNCAFGKVLNAEASMCVVVGVLTTLLGLVGQDISRDRDKNPGKDRDKETGEDGEKDREGDRWGEDEDADDDMYIEVVNMRKSRTNIEHRKVPTAVVDLIDNELAQGLTALAWVADKRGMCICVLVFLLNSSVFFFSSELHHSFYKTSISYVAVFFLRSALDFCLSL